MFKNILLVKVKNFKIIGMIFFGWNLASWQIFWEKNGWMYTFRQIVSSISCQSVVGLLNFFILWFALLDSSFCLLGCGSFHFLFLVFPLFWVLWFVLWLVGFHHFYFLVKLVIKFGLSPLLDGGQPTYLTNLREKKKTTLWIIRHVSKLPRN